MKMNIKGLVFVGFAAAVFASAANAAGEEKTVTSLKYTEATYQAKTAANQADKVLKMASNTAGDIGYATVDTTVTADSPNLITSGAVAAALEDTGNTIGTGEITIKDADDATIGSFGVNQSGDSSVTIPSFSTTANGLVAKPTAADQTAGKILSANNTWVEDQDTTYNVFSASENGLVNKPTAADQTAGKILSASNTWVDDANTTYTADDVTVEIDATSNNQIKAKTAAISGDTAQATLTTGGQVAAYLDGKVIPALSTCTAYPCALVATSASAYAWEPIQQ